ncbi:5441_t:CDS:2, partial [Funneliformis caledonium]
NSLPELKDQNIERSILSFRTIGKASRKYGFACPMSNLRQSASASLTLDSFPFDYILADNLEVEIQQRRYYQE